VQSGIAPLWRERLRCSAAVLLDRSGGSSFGLWCAAVPVSSPPPLGRNFFVSRASYLRPLPSTSSRLEGASTSPHVSPQSCLPPPHIVMNDLLSRW
jgi:hypothetical protein